MEKKRKIILLLVCAVIFIINIGIYSGVFGMNSNDTNRTSREETRILQNIEIGDIISYGAYYKEADDVKWIVLDIEEDKALVIANNILEPKRHKTIDKVDEYLDEIAEIMFINEEKRQIIKTDDSYLFLLNTEEIEKYMPGEDNSYRRGIPTLYAEKRNVKVYYNAEKTERYCNWILGDGNWVGGQVKNMGKIINDGELGYDFGIRPAMWVSIQN